MNGPFAVSALAYFEDGWSPIPIPPREKNPPADGFTGAAGKFVDELTLKRWLRGGSARSGKLSWITNAGNVALRLPPTVLGIDVDMYEGKAGRETFAKAIEAWGELPATWFTSSRDDGSGIRFYRIPEGLAWPGKLPQGGGVELIRWDHRFAIVGPSIHPDTGLPYQWFRDGISGPTDTFPSVEELPELPPAWVEGLTSGRRWEERPAAEMDDGDVRNWLSDRNGPDLCKTMQSTLARYTRQVREASDDGGVHDLGRNGAWALVGDAHAGHSGVEKALAKLKKVFIAAVARRSDKRLANEEWARIVVRGVQKVAAEGEAEPDDLCAMLSSGGRNALGSGDGEGSPRTGSAHLLFARTDAGNAERLASAHRHEQKFVEELGWFIWSPEEGRWVLDAKGRIVNRRAIAVARSVLEEAEYLAEEDPKEYAELRKFARASENVGKLRAMVEVSKDLKGMTLPFSDFDADPARLGRIVLKPNPGVEVTPALPEHRVTLRLGCDYDPGARSTEWSRFLRKVQPDPEIRNWLQRLVGYSLYGGNPDRLFIACFGDSSTGKTTFLKAFLSALGDYAGMVNMTIYRDNQDDKPRPDLLRILRKRVVITEEASTSWHLHSDQLKRITGGAPISARGMQSNNFVELMPWFTPWLFVNSPPTIEGADTAVLRRIVVVPWDVVIPKLAEDAALQERLASPENRPAVLRWALDGWTAYAGNPDLSAPVGTFYARQKFLSELSDFDRALAEIAVIEEGATVTPMELYEAYSLWCTRERAKQESNTRFGAFLSGRGFARLQKRVDGKPTWFRLGLRLTDDYSRVTSRT